MEVRAQVKERLKYHMSLLGTAEVNKITKNKSVSMSLILESK